MVRAIYYDNAYLSPFADWWHSDLGLFYKKLINSIAMKTAYIYRRCLYSENAQNVFLIGCNS